MYAHVNKYEMMLPRNYVDLSVEEMEYDGALSWKGLLGSVVIGAIGGAIAVIAAPVILPVLGIAVAGSVTGTAIAGGAAMGAITGAVTYPISKLFE